MILHLGKVILILSVVCLGMAIYSFTLHGWFVALPWLAADMLCLFMMAQIVEKRRLVYDMEKERAKVLTVFVAYHGWLNTLFAAEPPSNEMRELIKESHYIISRGKHTKAIIDFADSEYGIVFNDEKARKNSGALAQLLKIRSAMQDKVEEESSEM